MGNVKRVYVEKKAPFAVKAKELQERLHLRKDAAADTEIVTGMDGLIACATYSEATIVVAAVVGMIGIRPVIEAIKSGKDIAFANKETLVTAGHIIMPLVEKHGVKLLPVDSEHAAIFQCLQGEEHGSLHKILLTASGGPFRGKKKEELEHIRVEDALRHPNWSMGRKITIDSATMVNKGLEVIEARHLFDVDFDRIQVVLQPQSVIHSMVEFEDGAVNTAIMDYDKLEDEEFWNKYKLSEIWYTLEMYEDDKKKAILLGTILVNLLVDKGYIIQIRAGI